MFVPTGDASTYVLFFFFFFGVNNCSHRRHFPIILAHTHIDTATQTCTRFRAGGVTCTSISAFSFLLRSACRGRHLNCMASTQTWWIDFPEHQLYLGAVVKSSHGVSCLCIVVGIVRVRAHLLFTSPSLQSNLPQLQSLQPSVQLEPRVNCESFQLMSFSSLFCI